MAVSTGRRPDMQIISVNLGRPERLEHGSHAGRTGIFKRPVPIPVAVGELGLEGDAVLNTKHHGGPDQAVYLYRDEDYAWWADQLGHALAPGTFGENLTIRGYAEAGPAIGTRLAFDSVTLEVTAPRIPCATLGARMGDARFVKRFLEAERPGFYCRVITTGRIAPGERFTAVPPPGEPVTTLELFRASQRRPGAAGIRRLLSAPLDERSRRKLTRALDEAVRRA